MASELSRGIAATAWCFSKTQSKVMDTDLAEAFAEILDEQRLRPTNHSHPSAMVHIHEDLYLDAASVVSVRAKYADNPYQRPFVVEVAWLLDGAGVVSVRAKYEVGFDDLPTAQKLAAEIVERVNKGRGFGPPIVRRVGIDWAKAEGYTAVYRETLPAKISIREEVAASRCPACKALEGDKHADDCSLLRDVREAAANFMREDAPDCTCPPGWGHFPDCVADEADCTCPSQQLASGGHLPGCGYAK